MLTDGLGRTASQLRADDRLRTGVLEGLDTALSGVDLLASPVLGVAAVRNAAGAETVGPTSVAGVGVDPSIG
jgi:amidase/aspartyl-tRNA(Asn)/glutamyl-tRNA(Gln) amidotransferase subunit A